MKRLLIIATLAALLMAAQAYASGGRPHHYGNLNVFGSDDHKNNHTNEQIYYAPPSDPPTLSSVPEPATLLMLGSGLVAIAYWARRK